MSAAAPASGILCTELLQPTIPANQTHRLIGRSNIIQNLSLLVAFLDWVKPSAPNVDLCHIVKTIIVHVLDQTLNSQTDLQGAPVNLWNLGDLPNDQFGFSNFELLDTFDWIHSDTLME